jgi:hypothetical protein
MKRRAVTRNLINHFQLEPTAGGLTDDEVPVPVMALGINRINTT